mmetsp:Transcript_17656/g.40884  ORF Transcript_17656/g.40884 Transcript_17656/m.40884 type:complete len:220 (+) Transcript_17656:5097-5756(+)
MRSACSHQSVCKAVGWRRRRSCRQCAIQRTHRSTTLRPFWVQWAACGKAVATLTGMPCIQKFWVPIEYPSSCGFLRMPLSEPQSGRIQNDPSMWNLSLANHRRRLCLMAHLKEHCIQTLLSGMQSVRDRHPSRHIACHSLAAHLFFLPHGLRQEMPLWRSSLLSYLDVVPAPKRHSTSLMPMTTLWLTRFAMLSSQIWLVLNMSWWAAAWVATCAWNWR